MAVMPTASTTISERRPIAVPISWMTPSSIYIESAARTGFFKSPVSRTPMFLIRTDFVENCSGGIGKDPRKDDSEQNRRQSFEQEKPFPAGESSDAVHSQKDSGERTAKNGRCRNRHTRNQARIRVRYSFVCPRRVKPGKVHQRHKTNSKKHKNSFSCAFL